MWNTAQNCIEHIECNDCYCYFNKINDCYTQRGVFDYNQSNEQKIRSSSKWTDGFTFLHLCLLVLLCLNSTLAAPQTSCILCDKEDLRAREPAISDSYEEFTFDHQVSRQDAIQALRKYNETWSKSQNACSTIKCTTSVLNYCLGTQFLNDHCWCELQHREEGLPYVPHICYVGEKVYKPSVGSCFFFEEVKQCCCAAALVREWRHISGASVITPKTLLSSFLASLSLLYYRQRRRFNCYN